MPDKERILQKGRLLPQLESALAERYDLTLLDNEPDPTAYLAAHGAEFVGLTSSARFGADRALIAMHCRT